jgi:hypothetical protein
VQAAQRASLHSMAATNPLSPDPHRASVGDDREAVKEIARRAEELAAMGLRGEEFLRGFGIEEEAEPSVTITTKEELDVFFESDNGCAPSS